MSETGTIVTFIIVAFCFAAVLLMKKDSIEPKFKRPLAIMAIVMVGLSFCLLLYSFLRG